MSLTIPSLIIILILPAALLLGLIIRGLEAIWYSYRRPLKKVLEKSRGTKIEFQFIEPEISSKTGKRKKKHRDRRGYKKAE
jgi:hypothetical protein